jgi:hypothetical protein
MKWLNVFVREDSMAHGLDYDKTNENELFHISFRVDNVNTCKLNEVSVDFLIVCQLIIDVIRYYAKCRRVYFLS